MTTPAMHAQTHGTNSSGVSSWGVGNVRQPPSPANASEAFLAGGRKTPAPEELLVRFAKEASVTKSELFSDIDTLDVPLAANQ